MGILIQVKTLFQEAQLAAMFAVMWGKLGYFGPEFGGVVHLEKMAVFVDNNVLLYWQRQLGQVDVEIEVLIGGGRTPAGTHFFEADAADGAGGKSFQEEKGFLDDAFGGAAIEFFGEDMQLVKLLFGAEIITKCSPYVVRLNFQTGFFEGVIFDF